MIFSLLSFSILILKNFTIAVEIISLGFILAGLFQLTRVLGGSTFAGFVAMLLYTAETNNWILGSPASYANFFHHGLPYSYPLIIWSMVFFFQQRYTIAFLLAGISWSFHPMCTVFLLAAYGMYWLFNWKAFKPRTLLSCFLAFTVPAMPILVKALNNIGMGQLPDATWMKVVIWTAWYTCFPSVWPLFWLVKASLFFLLFLLSLLCLPAGRQKTGIKIFTLTFALMCLAGTVFADFYPVPFIIKLSLWRSTLIFLFLALPCIACSFAAIFNHTVSRRFLVIITIVLLTGYLKYFSKMYLPLLLIFLLYAQYEDTLVKRFPVLRNRFGLLLFIALAILVSILSFRTAFSLATLYLPVFLLFTIIVPLGSKSAGGTHRVLRHLRDSRGPWCSFFFSCLTQQCSTEMAARKFITTAACRERLIHGPTSSRLRKMFLTRTICSSSLPPGMTSASIRTAPPWVTGLKEAMHFTLAVSLPLSGWRG